MNKFIVVTFADANGRVIDIQTLKTSIDVTNLQITPGLFTDRKQATDFEHTLRIVSGLPTATAPHSGPLTRSKRKRVLSHHTGEIFPSAAAAARSIGVTTSAMTKHLRDPASLKELKTIYRFERID